ncbi:MAG: NAD(P)-dependent oxidoreductase [Acidimicrobiales bacterium]
MKILFADAIGEDRLAPLTAAGHDVVLAPTLGSDDIPAHIGGVDVLVVRSTRVTAATVGAADRLGLIVRAGAGTDTIDVDAASDAGIYVCNVPGRNAVAVAELTLGLLLAIDRQLADGVADLRAGRWDKARYSRADGLLGKTMAIVGLGDIGLEVAVRAKAFGIAVTALRKDDRSPDTQTRIRAVGIRLVDKVDELLAEADIVSIHIPAGADTVGLVDARFLARLRPGAVLLNTSRAEVVDDTALLAALDAGRLWAGLDVWPDEPSSGRAEFVSPLAAHPRVVGSHHIGASTEQAQRAVADGTIDVVRGYLEGRVVNCVNLNPRAVGTGRLSVRHRDRVGVLAEVLQVLRTAGINVQQMQNQIFSGDGAAVATIHVSGHLDGATVAALDAIDDVLAAAILPTPDHP